MEKMEEKDLQEINAGSVIATVGGVLGVIAGIITIGDFLAGVYDGYVENRK